MTTARVTTELERARAATRSLLAPLPDAELVRQVSPLMSPLVWDLAHVAHYEELWLVRALAGDRPGDPRLDDLYDAFRHPRRERSSLPILGPDAARAYAESVRTRTLEVLAHVHAGDASLVDGAAALLEGEFVYGMVVQHEHQHDETMLATIQLMTEREYEPAHGTDEGDGVEGPGRPRVAADEVAVDGGPFVMGTDDEPWAYDNERPAHAVEVAPFRIDVTPVTNAAYAEFVADGGYHDPRLWAPAGWAWRGEAALEHPQFWSREGSGTWSRLRFGRREDLPADEPVQHVCWYEADAFARWAGKRLPSEAEWERAATCDPAGRPARHGAPDDPSAGTAPNLGRRRFRPTPAGGGAPGPSGCHQMLGDVWEWTATDFAGYPGFAAFPYREYSEAFFGTQFKVLRGGSWATDPVAARGTFRNWDFPIRRQIFAGFRCARDA